MKRIQRFISTSDINVWQVLVYRCWTIVAGIATIVAIPRYLNVDTQGYYYTFLSIVALQTVFDLGLSQTITQISSHEFAHVSTFSTSYGVENREIAKLAYLKYISAKWYLKVGILFVSAVGIGGAFYFGLIGNRVPIIWVGPWIALVVATGLNLMLSPRLAIVEGSGSTGRVAQLRLTQSIVGYSALVVSLMNGAELWSVVAVPATANVMSLAWLAFRPNPYRAIPAFQTMLHDHLPWRSEILGLQWRVSISWIGGYLASQLMVPVAFAIQGAGEAGKVGLGLQIFVSVQSLGMSWISAQVPAFGQLIARAEWTTLKARFKRALISATLLTGSLAFAVVVAVEGASKFDFSFVHRVPSMFAMVLLAVISTLNTLVFGFAAYMRAHKEEPLVVSSTVIGLLTLSGVALAGFRGTDAMIFAYAMVTICLTLPWTLIIFKRYFQRELMVTVR